MPIEHHFTFWQWLNHHWAFISLVCFPTFMWYLSGAAMFFKVMGYTKLADFLGRFEQAVMAANNAMKAAKQQNPISPEVKNETTPNS